MESKLKKLENILQGLESVVVAYSGGVDSTFLLDIAKKVLGKNVIAVIATSPTYTTEELLLARKIAKKIKVKLKVIKTDELQDKNFIKNPANRCYFCKKELFSKLKEIKDKEKFENIIDGTNYDDKFDFRPGNLAKKEFGVISPLLDAKLTKEEIRYFSKKFKLSTHDKPSSACLASRIPYSEEITIDKLSKINNAEGLIRNLGFNQVRVRLHYGIARIEVEKDKIDKILDKKIREKILKKLKNLGFNYITIDLQGYRTGSMNENLNL